MARWLGIDGCRAGWLAVVLEDDGGGEFIIAERFARIAAIAAQCAMIDIPIGLPDSGYRACDRAARAMLEGARSRVFLGARRPLLAMRGYDAANAWAKADGTGLSRQLFNILPKIAEVDAFITPGRQAMLREAHPELVFRRLGGGRALPSKKTQEGRRQRRDLVRAAGLADIDRWIAALPRQAAAPDDLLDAAALAIAARDPRGTVPCAPETDARGLGMEIWY